MPCYKYKLELAICDVNDAVWNFCVFLGANSFKVEEFSFNKMTHSSGEGEFYIKVAI